MSQEDDAKGVHEGGCQCGAVRYRTSGNPVRAMACHCTTCKLRTGAAYGIGVYYHEQDVTFLQGDMSSYQYNSDSSGRWVQNNFCTHCGSAVSWTLEMRPGLLALAGGSFDNPDWYDIEAHIWTRSARSDMCYPKGMHVCDEVLK